MSKAVERAHQGVAQARRARIRGDGRDASTLGQEAIQLAIVGLAEVMLALLDLAVYDLEQYEGSEDEHPR